MNLNSKIKVSYPATRFEPTAATKDEIRRRAKNDPVGVMAAIVRNQHSLYTKEISHWKFARAEAENIYTPRRISLYDLYNDIALDPFLIGITQKRKLTVANKPWYIQNKSTKAKDEAVTELVQKEWVREFMKVSIDSHFYGHTLAYLWSIDEQGHYKELKVVPRKHVRPEDNVWVKHESDLNGFNYLDRPFSDYMIPVGKSDNLGLYNPAAPLYILKKHSWASWDEFEEIFGVPIRTAEVASNDSTVRAEVASWLKTMGTASYGLFPPEAKLTIHGNNQTDAFEVFNEKRKAVNEELEIMILGVKNASQDRGTYGQQKALQEEQDEVQEDDMTWIFNLINDELLPRLRKQGYPISEELRFIWDDTNWMEPAEKIKIYESLDKMGYELDQDQISEDLNVTIKGKRENADPTPPVPPAPKPKKKTPDAPEAKLPIQIMAELSNKYLHVPEA